MRAGGNEKREMNAEERIGRDQNVYEKKRNKGERKERRRNNDKEMYVTLTNEENVYTKEEGDVLVTYMLQVGGEVGVPGGLVVPGNFTPPPPPPGVLLISLSLSNPLSLWTILYQDYSLTG